MSKNDKVDAGAGVFRVGVYPVPGFALMSYACIVEPLRAANLLSERDLYEVVHFASDGASISSSGAAVDGDHTMGSTPPLDLLLVVAGGDPFAFGDADVFDWLKGVAEGGTRIGGVSGGSVLLVKAGLMEGRRMTVHWEHAATLAEQFPGVLIERRLYVIDRDRVTCGGGVAPLDLMLALIADHHGGVFARLVSDWFLHTDIRGAAAPQRAGLAERLGVHSPHLVEAVAAMENHIADPLTLKQLALIAGVSDRHLNRQFAETLGQSAMAYYRQLRLDVARRLLAGSALSVAEISDATGFSTQAHFSNAYQRRYDRRPTEDRRQLTQRSQTEKGNG